MAKRQQVLDRRHRPSVVVRDNSVCTEKMGLTVQEHCTYAETTLSMEIALISAGRYDYQAVDLAVNQGPGQFPLAIRVLIETADEHLDAPLSRFVLNRAQQGG
jgi:hypothetical protein